MWARPWWWAVHGRSLAASMARMVYCTSVCSLSIAKPLPRIEYRAGILAARAGSYGLPAARVVDTARWGRRVQADAPVMSICSSHCITICRLCDFPFALHLSSSACARAPARLPAVATRHVQSRRGPVMSGAHLHLGDPRTRKTRAHLKSSTTSVLLHIHNYTNEPTSYSPPMRWPVSRASYRASWYFITPIGTQPHLTYVALRQMLAHIWPLLNRLGGCFLLRRGALSRPSAYQAPLCLPAERRPARGPQTRRR